MRKNSRSSVMTLLLFVLAAVLLLAGTIGGTQAVLSVYSEEYDTNFALKNIGVTLYEYQKADDGSRQPKEISARDYSKTTAQGVWEKEITGNLIEKMVTDEGDSQLKVGKVYPFELCVANTGSIDTYVRVTLYKYWVDQNGNKITGIADPGWFNLDEGGETKAIKYDPGLIEITPAVSNVWEVQDSTAERMVFYYKGNGGVLPAGAPLTVPLTKSLKISSDILGEEFRTTTTSSDGTTRYEYLFNGLGFVVEAQVDAVQARHGVRSVPSAWGKTTLPGVEQLPT